MSALTVNGASTDHWYYIAGLDVMADAYPDYVGRMSDPTLSPSELGSPRSATRIARRPT